MDNDPAQASEKLRLATQLNPFQPEVKLWLGRALFQHNKSNDAVRELTAAYNEMRGSELVSVWLSEALAVTGQSNQAIRILDNDLKQWPIHVLSLISVARLRTQGTHVDSSALWAARKDLQLAASRLDQYSQGDLSRYSGDLDIDLNRSTAEVKGEIQRLLQQVENRLSQLTNQR